MNNKMNNKGFTIIEIIIAMTILSVVLGLGYNIILGTNRATKNQTEVFSEQQNANLVNKYLTKDLEQVKKFTPPEDTNLNSYTYIINDGIEDRERIEYEVKKTDDGKFYDLIRKANSGNIELISNYPTNSTAPFSITSVDNTDSLFKVSLNGKNGDNEFGKYQFDVASRVHNDTEKVDTSIEEVSSIGGQIVFNYEKKKNLILLDEYNAEITASALNDNKKDENHTHSENIESLLKVFDKDDKYKIYATIPLNSRNLKVGMYKVGIFNIETNIFGSKDNIFKNKKSIADIWSIFEGSANDNNKIYIYSDNLIKIKKIKINGSQQTEIKDQYIIDTNKDINLELEITIDEPRYSLSNQHLGKLVIGFGKFTMN